MLRKTDTTLRDPEAILLGKIYALILSWGDSSASDDDKSSDARLTERKDATRAKREGREDEK